MMIAIKAHFDGKVIVPEEPVDLQADQQIVVTIEATGSNGLTSDPRDWTGIANRYPTLPNHRVRSDDDLWRKDDE